MRRPASPRRGFTLVEATIALAIMGIAASALLLNATSSTETTDNVVRQFIAMGLAQTTMDEISGMRYHEPGGNPYQTPLQAESGELVGVGRTLFDDLDDYHGLRLQPPQDRGSQTWGNDNDASTTTERDPNFRVPSTFFSRWRLETDVFYVNSGAWLTPLASGATSNYRTVQIRVIDVDPQQGDIELARHSRTFTYVDAP